MFGSMRPVVLTTAHMKHRGQLLNVPKVRQLMALEEISQKQLADRVGVAPSTLSEWLKGKGMPNGTHLAELAKALDAEPTDLVLERPEISIGGHSVVYNNFYSYFVFEGARVTINVSYGGPPPAIQADDGRHGDDEDETS